MFIFTAIMHLCACSVVESFVRLQCNDKLITTNPIHVANHHHDTVRDGSTSTFLMNSWRCEAISTSHTDCNGLETNNILLHNCQQNVLSSPRLWLEHNTNGVYTVLRIDLEHQETAAASASSMSIWGLDFHLNRLEHSYENWFDIDSENTGVRLADEPQAMLKRARQETQCLLNQLLQEAGNFVKNKTATSDDVLFMVTILWHPTPTSHQLQSAIQVRGQISETTKPLMTPITATLAIPFHNNTIMSTSTDDALLPSRRHAPGLAECKFSSWCRERRPLEARFQTWLPLLETARSKAIGARQGREIILTEIATSPVASPGENGDGTTLRVTLRLLEGLTSNLFLVYPNRMVRTAPTPLVLPGFARYLALSLLPRLGYTIDTNTTDILVRITDGTPLVAADIAEALSSCQEVFVTSAIKLVVPVDTIFVDRTIVWSRAGSYSPTEDGRDQLHKPSTLCECLFHEILIRKQDFVINTQDNTRTSLPTPNVKL